MKVFHAGLPAWKKAGGLVVSGPVGLETWIKGGETFVLVDLRDAAAAEKGFIPGAIGIPAKDLASWKDRFPENKKAPIVLYDAAQASPEAFKTVRGWGYVNTTVLRQRHRLLEGRAEDRPPRRAGEDRVREKAQARRDRPSTSSRRSPTPGRRGP